MGRSRKKNPGGRQPESSDQSVKIERADTGEAKGKKKTADRIDKAVTVNKSAVKREAVKEEKTEKEIIKEKIAKEEITEETVLKEEAVPKKTVRKKVRQSEKRESLPKDKPRSRKAQASQSHASGQNHTVGHAQNDQFSDTRSRAKQGKRSGSDNELRRYVLLLAIVLVALILVVVVLVSDGLRDTGTDTEAALISHTAEALPDNTEIPVIEPDTKEYFHDFGGSILSQDTVPEINQLMEQYFLSISECDMATFLHLFVSEDTSEEEHYRKDFEKQKQYIEGYQNISCYTAPGLEKDSYAAYVYYEIKYVGVETPAPSLVQIYAVKGSDGVYRIYDQAVSPELEDLLGQLAINEDVRLLISQVDQKAEEAMAADPALNERIQYMKQGPDYMREEETQAAQVQGEESSQGSSE